MQRRMTTQKRIVYDTIKELGHVTVEDLISHLQVQYEHISLATIYRNIQTLTAEHQIKLVKLNDMNVLETVKSDHVHFVCESCGAILDMEFDKKKMIGKAFKDCVHQIHQCDVAFYGLCQKCMGKEKNDEVRL
ncbi:hypothetical protein HDR67_00990 [bacterium]|nr:hypothetical protein [bacterium]